jgi:hypothetical protein
MATQQFGYGPNVWAPAKGVGAVAIPKLLQPGAVAPQFKSENKYMGMAAKAIGEMMYDQFLGGREEETDGTEGNELTNQNSAITSTADLFKESAMFDPDAGASYVDNVVPTSPFEPSTDLEKFAWLKEVGVLDEKGNQIPGRDVEFDAATANKDVTHKVVKDGQSGTMTYVTPTEEELAAQAAASALGETVLGDYGSGEFNIDGQIFEAQAPVTTSNWKFKSDPAELPEESTGILHIGNNQYINTATGEMFYKYD